MSIQTLSRSDALPYVAFVVDDSGSCGPVEGALSQLAQAGYSPQWKVRNGLLHAYPSVLVGWQCGFEPLFVAVHSYLDVALADDECEEIAREYLAERGWFSGEPTDADFIIR